MRYKEIQNTGPSGLDMAVSYPNSVAFLYSPQLVRIECLSEDPGAIMVAVGVTHVASGRSYRETRNLYKGSAVFDISRIMQLLAPDVDELFRRLDGANGACLSERFELSIEYNDDDWHWLIENEPIDVLYGALDQGEIYGGHTQRRLYMNFPQTFNLWDNDNGNAVFYFGDDYVMQSTQEGPCHECDLVALLNKSGGLDNFKKMLLSRPQLDVELTWHSRIEKGTETAEPYRMMALVPDYSKPGEGTYLRWLNRRGEVSYGFFRNSQLRVTSSAHETFSRYYANDPSEPVAGAYINTQKTDYNEAREMIIGAVGLSYDEFQDMCDLATSPLVEMFVPEQSLWQRVNIVAGTFERNIRRSTPSRQDLEIIIRLPERNTIKL